MGRIKDVVCPDCGQKFRMFEKEYKLMVKGDMHLNWLCIKCPRSNEHYTIALKKKVAAVPHEIKQKIIDLMFEGLSVGEVKERVNLELDIVAHVISDNIGHYSYLKREVPNEVSRV